jgi:hypothetical protein
MRNRCRQEGKWEYSGGAELVLSVVHIYMELSQCNPLILLMCANSKRKEIEKEIFYVHSLLVFSNAL